MGLPGMKSAFLQQNTEQILPARTMKPTKYLLTLLTLSISLTAPARGLAEITLDTLPHFHRENLPVKPDETLLTKSCEELDTAISYLTPATYQYKPDFNDDKYNGAAIWGSTMIEIAWLYLPYSWFMGYQEETRQHQAFYKLEELRQAKAIKQCYVN